MCDKLILTPWPGHKEICSGYSHSYLEEMTSALHPGRRAMMRVTPDMFGQQLEGTFHAPCPDSPKIHVGGPRGQSSWEMNAEREARENRALVDAYFIRREQTLENYDAAFNGHEEDVKEVRRFLRHDDLKRLILKGDVGRGKSHLAQACINAVGFPAVMISASKLYWVLRDAESFEPDEIALKAQERLQRARMIALDDLGVEKLTDSQLFIMGLQDLLETFTGKLIVTTNLSEQDMGNRYGQKITSRLYDNAAVIVLKGNDFRRIV